MRILDGLFLQANANPGRPAMGLADRTVTYDMLAHGTLSVENRAKMSGMRPRDLVAVAITSPIRQLIVVFALMRLGAVYVSIDDANGTTALYATSSIFQ